jgi:hypothetical protein
MISCVALAAFAAPAFAGPPTTAPAGGVAGTTSANPLAAARSFDPAYGQSAFGGNYGLGAGSLGQLQPDYVQSAQPYGQFLQTNGWTCSSGTC